MKRIEISNFFRSSQPACKRSHINIRTTLLVVICAIGIQNTTVAMAAISLSDPLLEVDGMNNANDETLIVDSGDALSLTWSVTNNAPSAGTTSFTHYISDNAFISSFDTPVGKTLVNNSLSQSQINATLTIADLNPGLYYIGTCRDLDNQCNGPVIAGTVKILRLLLSNPVISTPENTNLPEEPVSVQIRRRLIIEWAVENRVTSDTETVFTHYLSTDEIVDPLDQVIGSALVDNNLEISSILTEARMPNAQLGVYNILTCENTEDNCKTAGAVNLLEADTPLTTPVLLFLLDDSI